ncbi:MAG: hypothetical protein ABI151_05325, partial [Chitinophagaceae bacterium]
NSYGVTHSQFAFFKDRCSWRLTTKEGTKVLDFGWENWILNADNGKYIFPVPGRFDMPSQIAGTATWIDDNTLQLNARLVESMHGDKMTCRFKDGQFSAKFLNSVSEHTKDNLETREELRSV